MAQKTLHLGEAWFKKHGVFKVTVTPNGGMKLFHPLFRQLSAIQAKFKQDEEIERRVLLDPSRDFELNTVTGKSRRRLFVEEPSGRFGAPELHFKTLFSNFFLAHAMKDFEECTCTVVYLDADGRKLNSINFEHWLKDRGTEKLVAATENFEGVRIYLSPMQRHIVPRGTKYIVFRLEDMSLGGRREVRYGISAEVVRDMREQKPNRRRANQPPLKRASSM